MTPTTTQSNENVQHALNAMKKAGADKAHCVEARAHKHELNVEAGNFSLMRTTVDTHLKLRAIRDNKQGELVINKTDPNAITSAAREVVDLAAGSRQDSAYDIAEAQPAHTFSAGPAEPDLDQMYDGTRVFLDEIKERFPLINMNQLILTFNRQTIRTANTNGVNFSASNGGYFLFNFFSAKDGNKTSSFNYSGACAASLDSPLIELADTRSLIEQSIEHLNPKSVPTRFVGDIIITPHCLNDFIYYFSTYLTDPYLISKTGIYAGKLNSAIADKRFSLHATPLSNDIVDKKFVTDDGYAARDFTIVQNGVLKNYLLSQYGAHKTGLTRAPNDSTAYVVDAGDESFDDIVKAVKKGLLLCRFSGGSPDASGEVSGVAKNSFYIEDGKIQYPLSETMVSSNIADIFTRIAAISRERINFGNSILPWVKTTDITISGKS